MSGDTHPDIWLQHMDSAGQAQGTKGNYADEGVKEDRGGSRLDRVRNVDLRDRLKQEGVLDTVKKRQQSWKQRVEEMSTNRVTRKIYDEEIPGRRPRGRPRKRWRCNFD